MIKFIKHFYQYKGKFEFILNNKGDLKKSLFYFQNNNSEVIFDYINNKLQLNSRIKEIFKLYGSLINHIGYNKPSNKYKFYIGLYNENFKNSLIIINKCKNILGIKEKYFLEKDFYKFDCIGFDITEKGIDIKIYELVKKENNYFGLPNYIKKNNVKEIGYLKTLGGRKKKFFRFNKYKNIEEFKKDFILKNINFFEKLKLDKKVKYYCIEGDKKELYFI